jgi:hypothetical protein
MPKNTTGGNKAKKGKNSGQRIERPLILADNSGEQNYGIIDAFGGSTATVKYIRQIKPTNQQPQQQQQLGGQTETITAVGFIRNSLRKWCKRFIRGDVVLICEREFEKGKVDIVHKYNDDELRALKRLPQVYVKIQPLAEAYSLKMDKQSGKTGQPEMGDGIEFDENYSGSEDETSDSENSASALETAAETQLMIEMNAEYSSERQGGYKSMSARQRNDNPKYAKSANKGAAAQAYKKPTGGRPIAQQRGTREMPPSESESEIDVLDGI